MQGHQVLSQQEVYGLRPEARSRINTIYMSTIFLVGAMASAVAGWVFDRAGWTGVTTVALLLPAGVRALDHIPQPGADRHRTHRRRPPPGLTAHSHQA